MKNIELTKEEFDIILDAVQQGLKSNTFTNYPAKTSYFKVDDGSIVEKPTAKQIKEEKVVEQIDVTKTFQNPQYYFTDKVTPSMVKAESILLLKRIENEQDIAE